MKYSISYMNDTKLNITTLVLMTKVKNREKIELHMKILLQSIILCVFHDLLVKTQVHEIDCDLYRDRPK